MLKPEETIIEIKDERQLKSVCGVTESQLKIIAQMFELVEKEEKKAQYEQMVHSYLRVRKPGGGHKGVLKTPLQKVLIVLVYCKSYSTYDDLGSRFGLSKSAAFDNIERHFPRVRKALARLGVLPYRTFHNVEEFKEIFEDIEEIIIDVTERQCQRPQNPEQQKEVYSGKKRRPTYKNTIISTLQKYILFIGLTFTGHNHDYKMLKSEFPTKEAWFEHFRVFVDLGYQGIVKDYGGEKILIPHKKPRKSKNNPNPCLTDEQKQYNKELSKTRILIENAISGMKRFNILVHAFRNKKPNFIDDVIVLCAGLWNLNVTQNL